MRYEWSLFELHRLIFLEERLTELKELLGSNLNLDKLAINEHTTRIDLLQEHDDSINRFTIFCNAEMRVPMVLCFAGEDQWIQLLCSWLKSQGVIVLPIELDSQAMLSVADEIIGLKSYDTKLIFDVTTTDRNLRKLELEVDKESFQRLTRELTSHTALQDIIVPYIYQRSGMIIEKLPLTMISFTGAASITHDKIVVSSWSNDTLKKLLEVVQ
ncbi:hypothetical protein ZYGR_0I06890 [Zygosaccharomyces rouxii]|uniref:ZYRO0C16302p n=2 Tax=Zygosaccharomyces rouxii TaxID=4956 RepID=C5DUF4_ZYGRC|nr:uncharacterized protein ZYRO0C16302g [Zygosaccharomyces rouxii]KAH9201414.1 hypothetical protein LQ764DRAFT_233227 [Zygosaccharomyces rouxii]GAV48392.1 hypothetical protein ZYGR_0I06890 [Zygosaccharomyces rouxii]CAR27415.1 ZYRO0C16302p [Zygosaccharomyces rouxii]